MRITVKNADLARELALLEKIVGKKPTIPVLANVLMQANAGGLLMSATDLEVGLIGACMADVHEPGAVTLPAKKFMEIVRAQDGADLTLTTDTRGAVKFTSGKFLSRLQSLPAEDFPSLPSIDGHPSITIPRDQLKGAIAQTRFSISEKDQRYFLKGALLTLPADKLTIVSTDSKRISVTTIPRPGPEWESVLVPVEALDELDALLSEAGTDDITFARSDRHIFFDLDGRLLISRQVDGKFPAWERIIPKANEHVAQVERFPLISMLRRAILINEIINVSFDTNTIDISAASSDVGDGLESLPAVYAGPKIVCKFKGEYLIEWLNQAVGSTVNIKLKDSESAALFVDGEYLNVIGVMK